MRQNLGVKIFEKLRNVSKHAKKDSEKNSQNFRKWLITSSLLIFFISVFRELSGMLIATYLRFQKCNKVHSVRGFKSSPPAYIRGAGS